MPLPTWICAQLGAREHYSVPRAMHQRDQLGALITDAWVSPRSALNGLPHSALRGLRDRYHPDLSTASVKAFTPSLISFEIAQRLRKSPTDWDCMIARNRWFQRQTVRSLQQLASSFTEPPVLFSYSYAALDLFRFAKQQGWTTVLGQMDPGKIEEQLVIEEYSQYPDLASGWQKIPDRYWQTWQQECELADHIIVNSKWSEDALQQTGISKNKLEIVPLVYQPPSEATQFQRSYPKKFSSSRPLRVLFLGLVTLRKGIGPLLKAMQQLEGAPIELHVVGPLHIQVSESLRQHPQIRWVGPVPRSQVAQQYQTADVFIFPTISDGFGLTQLEAQAWKLPIIASSHCGQVVEDKRNGLLLAEISADAIAQSILYCYKNPDALANYSERASANSFQLRDLSQRLNQITTSTINTNTENLQPSL